MTYIVSNAWNVVGPYVFIADWVVRIRVLNEFVKEPEILHVEILAW